jgi:hypothetical protein
MIKVNYASKIAIMGLSPIMKFKAYFLVVSLLFCKVLFANPEQYLCVVEHTTGFAYNKDLKKCVPAVFKSNKKYIISKSDNQCCSFKVTEIGKDSPISFCKDGFNKSGFLFCGGTGDIDLKFNKYNGRFILSHFSGYFNVLPETNELTDISGDTPYISIDVCSPF